MADPQKTEKATPKRRGEARKKGQVAKSHDLNTAVVLAGGLIMVTATGPSMANAIGSYMTDTFAWIAKPAAALPGAGLNSKLHAVITLLLATVAPIAAVCMVSAVVVNVLTTGLHASTYSLKPNPKRLNPISGAKNL